MPIEISFVMPCLNEVRTLGTCIDKAKKLISSRRLNAEIVVADNGSVDGSKDVARSMGARVVEVAEKGYGRAIMAGVRAAFGKYVIMGDSDDSYDFSESGNIIDELRAGADMVIGNRFAGTIHPGAMPWSHRYVGVPMLSFVARVVGRSKVIDFHCGLRGFDREALLKLNLVIPGMEWCTEMIFEAERSGWKIGQVPVNLYPDGRDRPPHLRTIPDGFKNLFFMLSYAAKRRR